MTIMHGVFEQGISFLLPQPLLMGFQIMQDPMHCLAPPYFSIPQHTYPSIQFSSSFNTFTTDPGAYVQSSYAIVPSMINSIHLVRNPHVGDLNSEIRMAPTKRSSHAEPCCEIRNPQNSNKAATPASPPIVNKKIVKLRSEEVLTPSPPSQSKGTPPEGTVYIPRTRKRRSL